MIKKKTAKPRGGPGRLSTEDAAKLPDRLLDAAGREFGGFALGDFDVTGIGSEGANERGDEGHSGGVS